MSTAATNPEQKSIEKALQKENKALRAEIKQLEIKVKTFQGDLSKSTALKDRLEGLCRELQKQNRFIKAESSAKIAEANAKGKELAQEVQNNMGFMKNINQNLASITSESLEVKRENEDLAKKIATLKDHYEEREKILQTALSETNALLLITKQELGEFKLKNAEEKEKLYGEMQQLANALVKSREQMKEAKETEITLRNLIQNYDDKFNGLQKALKDTNGAYDEFKSEMSKVTGKTKDLEKETSKWQSRWEESNTALCLMEKNHQRLQGELVKAQESLAKMTNLCRALQVERKELLSELKVEEEKRGIKTKPDEAELQLNERAKLVEDVANESQLPSEDKVEVGQTEEKPPKDSSVTSPTPAVKSDEKSVEAVSNLQDGTNKPLISNNDEDKGNETSQDESSNNINTSKSPNKGKNKSAPTSPSKTKNKKSQNKNQSQPCSPSKKESPQKSEDKQTAEKVATQSNEEKQSPITETAPQTDEPQVKLEESVSQAVDPVSTEEKVENIPSVDATLSNDDSKPENKTVNKQPENKTVDKQPENKTVDKKPENITVDKKPENKTVDKKPENKTVDKQPENKTVDKKPENKTVDKKPENKTVDKQPETSAAPKKVPEEVNTSENVSAPQSDPEKVTKPEMEPLSKSSPETSNPENVVKSNDSTPVSPKPPTKDTPKSTKKGQGNKPNSGEEMLPKPNKKSKKHK